MASRTYKVTESSLETLNSKLEHFARKARKLGVPCPVLTTLSTERVDNEYGVDLVHTVKVEVPEEVKIQGWALVAVAEHTSEGNIMRGVGEGSIPSCYRTSTLCEHCHTNRPRKHTYILQHESGEYKQVGGDCMVDFLGHSVLSAIERAIYAQDVLDMCESMSGLGKGSARYLPLEVYLAYVAECIEKADWVSKARASAERLESTSSLALAHMCEGARCSGFEPLFESVSDKSKDVAEKAIAWASMLEGDAVSDYHHNIGVVARRMVCSSTDMGLAASIIIAHQKHLESLKVRSESQYVGVVGEKVRVKIVVERIVDCESMYGTTYLHIMRDMSDNVFTWFSSSGCLDKGKEIILDGTVKDHTSYKGTKQTVLIRCKIVEIHKYACIVADVTHYVEAVSETECKQVLKSTLGVKRLPSGVQVSVVG